MDPPPPKEERPRRERRRFEDVDANEKNGDVSKWDKEISSHEHKKDVDANGKNGDVSKRGKEISSHEQKKGDLPINGDSQSGDARNVSVIIVA